MRRMTAAAVAFLDRLMQKRAVLQALTQRLVAALAQLALLHDQQSFMPGDMGIVALIAALFDDRPMNHRPLEFPRLMAIETGRSEARRRQDYQEKPDKCRRQQGLSYAFHYRPPV